VIKSVIGQRLDALIHRLFPFLFWRPLDPNTLTVLGTLVSLGAGWAFAESALMLGGILILAGGFFDLVDGVVARHQGVATRFGGFLDSSLDRLVDMVLLVGISVHYARAGEPGGVLLAGIAATTSVLVSYSKARAELDGPSIDVGVLERGERIGLLAAGSILGFLGPALWLIVIGSTITVAQRFAAARRALDALDASERGDHDEEKPA
jgi:phosphatidylglycerophosphate synthase